MQRKDQERIELLERQKSDQKRRSEVKRAKKEQQIQATREKDQQIMQQKWLDFERNQEIVR